MKKHKRIERVECPFCSEEILPNAKKCRFCGEWISREIEKHVAEGAEQVLSSTPEYVKPFYLWGLTMAIFYLILSTNNFDLSKADSIMSIFLLADVVVGIVLFILLLVKLNKSLYQSNKKLPAYLYTFATLGCFVLFFYAIVAKASDTSSKINPTVLSCPGGQAECLLKETNTRTCLPIDECIARNKPTVTPSPPAKKSTSAQTANKTEQQKVECIGPDGKHFNTTMDECKKLNEKWGKSVDYMINCNIHQDCGGGTVYMAKSQCDKPCSGLKTNTNTSTTQAVTSTNNSNKTAVFISYGGFTVYCPSQNVGAVTQIANTMENKKMEWAKNYNECSDIFTNNDPCWVNCKSTHTWSECEYGTPDYQSCSDNVSASYQECISSCPSISNHCDYTYAEQKRLNNEINNLCK